MKKLFTILTFAIAFNTFGQVPNYVPTNGLVGWWPYNGDAYDESGNGIHGTVSGASLTTDRFGQTNSAYYFNGTSDYIRMTGLPTNYSSYTFSAWVKSYLVPPISEGTGIVVQTGYKTSVTLVIGSYGLSTSEEKINGRHRLNNSNLTAAYSINSIDLSWHFYCLTWDGTSIKLYVDGELNDTKNALNTDEFRNELIVGGLKYASAVDYFFNGKIDDIGIWNRSLTQNEIIMLYQGPNINVNETNNIKSFSIYPNPATSQINLRNDNYLFGENYSIYDSYGKLVLKGKILSENTIIEINNLSEGIYLLSIEENYNQTFKVIKK